VVEDFPAFTGVHGFTLEERPIFRGQFLFVRQSLQGIQYLFIKRFGRPIINKPRSK
jgi:hypothetical protein